MTELPFKPSLEMTFATVQADSQRLVAYSQKIDVPVLAIDLSQVIHCDSAGLALLIEAKKWCKAQGKQCTIKKVPEMIRALAKFCEVDKLLEIEAHDD